MRIDESFVPRKRYIPSKLGVPATPGDQLAPDMLRLNLSESKPRRSRLTDSGESARANLHVDTTYNRINQEYIAAMKQSTHDVNKVKTLFRYIKDEQVQDELNTGVQKTEILKIRCIKLHKKQNDYFQNESSFYKRKQAIQVLCSAQIKFNSSAAKLNKNLAAFTESVRRELTNIKQGQL